MIESGRPVYQNWSEVDRYIKIWSYLIVGAKRDLMCLLDVR